MEMLNYEPFICLLLKMKIKIVPVTILCIVALLTPITYAVRVRRAHNIIPDPSFESKGITKRLRDLAVYDANEDGFLDGSIEIT